MGYGTCMLVCVTLDWMSSVVYYTKQGDMELLHTSAALIHPTYKLDPLYVCGQSISNDLN